MLAHGTHGHMGHVDTGDTQTHMGYTDTQDIWTHGTVDTWTHGTCRHTGHMDTGDIWTHGHTGHMDTGDIWTHGHTGHMDTGDTQTHGCWATFQLTKGGALTELLPLLCSGSVPAQWKWCCVPHGLAGISALLPAEEGGAETLHSTAQHCCIPTPSHTLLNGGGVLILLSQLLAGGHGAIG